MEQDSHFFQEQHVDWTDDQAKEERAHVRVWVGRVLALLATLIFTVWVTEAYPLPIAQAEADGALVTLTDEDCLLVEHVSNLKKRATWKEKGRIFEGCYGVHPAFPIVMAYFNDKTFVVIPVEMFTRVTGA